MTKQNVTDKVKKIVRKQLGVSMNQIVDSADYSDDFGADWLDRVELIMAFEGAFRIAIPESDAEKIDTVGKTIDYLCGVLGVKEK